MTFEEYKEFYSENGRCIDQFSTPNKSLNERQLSTKYKNFLRKEERKAIKYNLDIEKIKNKQFDFEKERKGTNTDERWQEIKKQVYKRDRFQCQLLCKQPKSVIDDFKEFAGNTYNILTPAHILNKASNPEAYYDIDNIVTLNQVSHGLLDNQKNPILGTNISKLERWLWWLSIIGENWLFSLLKKYTKYSIIDTIKEIENIYKEI